MNLTWTNWLILGVGTLVTSLVFAILYWRWTGWRSVRLRALAGGAGSAISDDDLPWEDLLQLLRKRGKELAESGAPPDDNLPPEELLKLLLSQLPSLPPRGAVQLPQEEVEFLATSPDRRGSRRRWGNPTEIFLSSPLWTKQLHGLVINRSATGLAIFVDMELQPGTFLKVRSVEAPYYVPWVDIEIKYSKKAGRNHIIGCQFRFEVPWNVRVWFG